MSKIKYFVFLLALGAFAVSCSDDGDGASPIVTISSPAQNSTWTVADTIPLVGTVTDETALGEIKITSTLGLDLTITSFDSDTSHALNYNLTLDPSTTAGAYTITIEASDVDENLSTTNLGITIE